MFHRVQKYGLAMLVTTDQKLEEYINNVLAQLRNWLLHGSLPALVYSSFIDEKVNLP